MKRRKKHSKKRPERRKRRGTSLREIRETLKTQRENPAKIEASPRLQKVLAAWKDAEPVLRKSIERATEPLISLEKRHGQNLNKLYRSLDDDPEASLADKDVDTVISVLEALEGRRGAPVKPETRTRIRRAAELEHQGVLLSKQAPLLFPGKANGQNLVRALHSRYRSQIEAELQQIETEKQRPRQPKRYVRAARNRNASISVTP